MAPLIPVTDRPTDRNYQRRAGAGHKRKDSRLVFSAIVDVLRAGCQWKALPGQYGSARLMHKYFQMWHRVGFFRSSGRPDWPSTTACTAFDGSDRSQTER